ncbi:glyoxalase [Marinobacter halodurans]|uniref:Glyoxalase n=1 Tax=Marinobacter halodurans TaxID=2528979 RepID=A0ABY1ZGU3_9GAMM|nr:MULTISPECIES: VOC family protein [Marinobacter]ROU02093.1 glyoxalase [Marinobacter sp. R17]TBW49110.1 glyoxalase [Marinobacter halodurans]
MKVKRIVPNIATDDPAKAAAFYETIFGLDIIMDHGWLRTYSSGESMTVQLGVASEGGSGTLVPDLSIEVDDLDEVLERVHTANVPIDYGPVEEPWGVRRFFVRDPFGKIVNVLQHL